MTRIEAILMYDSGGGGSTVPADPSSSDRDRSLCFQSKHITVDLVIHPEGGALRVIYGQVFESETGLPVEGARVYVKGQHIRAHTDVNGEFALSSVGDGGAQPLCVDSAGLQLSCPLSEAGVAA